MSSPQFADRLSKIPKRLRIRVLHDSEEFVVIEKPCNLRSVPGHANPPLSRKRPRSSDEDNGQRRTAQEAWVLAIQSFREDDASISPGVDDTNGILSRQCLHRLASMEDKLIESIPRKLKFFRRYLERNKRTLMQGPNHHEIDLDELANAMFLIIQKRQKPLMNLPEATRHEESAWGQLVLLGYGNNDSESGDVGPDTICNRLFVVHRLDCETSGTMVFAKTPSTASILSKAWRERDQVSKHYLAVVQGWPPFQEENLTEGIITVPLAPSDERLKWKVDNDGKESTTEWKVFKDSLGEKTDDESEAATKRLVLELKPITGRTHQLRIHCAHIGSGIDGDSLYGANKVDFDPLSDGKLKLHAWKLIFPHPNANELCEFSCSPTWLDLHVSSSL